MCRRWLPVELHDRVQGRVARLALVDAHSYTGHRPKFEHHVRLIVILGLRLRTNQVVANVVHALRLVQSRPLVKFHLAGLDGLLGRVRVEVEIGEGVAEAANVVVEVGHWAERVHLVVPEVLGEHVLVLGRGVVVVRVHRAGELWVLRRAETFRARLLAANPSGLMT